MEIKYCAYCKRQILHDVIDDRVNEEGTGRKLTCTKCGSTRLGEIQGFDAALM